MKNNNRVAILLSTYNSSKYLQAQLESLIAQTYKSWSLFIRDDGSLDNTKEIIKHYCDSYQNIYYFEDSQSLGPKLSFMKLWRSVDSEYYMFFDHDDVWCPEKVRLSVLEADNQKDNLILPIVVATDLQVVDESLKELSRSFWNFQKVKDDDFNNYKLHWFANNVNGCTMLINQKCKEISLPIPNSAYMHDSWVVLSTLAHKGRVVPIHKQLVKYRQHGSNTLGAKKNNFTHYIYDFNKVIDRTINQYKTIRTLEKVSFLKFILLKIMFRISVL